MRHDLDALIRVIPFVLSFCLERNAERARVHDFEAVVKRLKRLRRSMTPVLESAPTHIDRALARSRSGDLSQDRDLIRQTERIDELATGLIAIDVYPETPEPVRELKSILRKLPRVSSAVGQALDIVLTRSLEKDDIATLLRDVHDLVKLADGRLEVAGHSSVQAASWIAGDELELVVAAVSVLLSIWNPPRTKYRRGQAWEEFQQFVTEVFSASSDAQPLIPDEIESSLAEVSRLLVTARWEGWKYAGAGDTADRECRRILAHRVVDVSKPWARTIVEQPTTVRSRGPAMRMGLLAAAAVADRFAEQNIASTLRGVYSCLTCLDARQDDPHLASEVILLTRT
jgi:hypothetical protein